MEDESAVALEATQALEVWLSGVKQRLSALHVVDRLPEGGGMPVVLFEGGVAEEEDEFIALTRVLQVKVVYVEASSWGDEEIAEYLSRLRGARELLRQGFPENLDDLSMMARIERCRGLTAQAAVQVVADGVAHRLRHHSDWWVALRLVAVEEEWRCEEAAAARAAVADAQWKAEQDRVNEALRVLTERLQTDEEFLASRSSTTRRNRAQNVLRKHASVTDLPSWAAAGATRCAQQAWSWWLSEGLPDRELALRERLPELVEHPSLQVPLRSRKRAVRALLEEIDPAAVSAAMIEELYAAAGAVHDTCIPR